MKRFVLWLLLPTALLLLYRSCGPRNKMHHLSTTSVNSYNHNNGCPVNLYREYYKVFDGYMATGINSVYLTDSTNFKLFIGVYDEGGEFIDSRCKRDSIIITKYLSTNQNPQWNFKKVAEQKRYSISLLKAGHVFD